MDGRNLKIIAHIKNGFTLKFGIPRQSGMVGGIESRIIFEPEYRDLNAVRGLDGFSHIWLLWEFSESVRDTWSPTVRPPRLGGNARMGVFATRSPFRPNPIGLSSVRLSRVEITPDNGPVLVVLGADLLDGTPIYDIKPYLAFTDSHEDASAGFTDAYSDYRLRVDFPEEISSELPAELTEQLKQLLAADPRPSYHNSPDRVYGMEFSGYDIRFKVESNVLTVLGIEKKRHLL